jgi:uncharacterized membrane protein HdeD (DUF308 family)
MSKVKIQVWLGVLDIVLGLVSVLLSTIVLTYPGLDILTLVLMLAGALLVIGLARVIFGAFGDNFPDWLRTVNVVAGLFEIAVTLTCVLFPQSITQTLIQLLSFALLVHGAISILVGRFAADLPSLPRALLMLFGLSSVALSVAALISMPLGFLTLVYMLSIGYLLNGIAEIMLGVTGIRWSQNGGLLGRIDSTVQKAS